MAQLSIYDKQRHHSKKDFTCSIGARDYIYITFRHESWKRFTNSEYIMVIRTDNGAFKFGDPKTTGIGSTFKLKTDKKGDPQTREHTRYLQIDGKKYPGFLEIARRTAGSYDFPKQEEPKKNEAVEFLKKLAETGDNVTPKTEPAPATYPPLNLGELFQLAINNAVALAFAKYKDDERIAQKAAWDSGYRRGFDAGIRHARQTDKDLANVTQNSEPDKDKWSI
jgi:hypothetical protein